MYKIELYCKNCGNIWVSDEDITDDACPECGSKNFRGAYDNYEDEI